MDASDWLDLATGAAWVALGLVLLRMRADGRVAGQWLLVVVALCALRAFDFIAVEAGGVDAAMIVRVLDVLVLATLLALVVGAARLGRDLALQRTRATHAQGEYGRALLDYTQLVRHRIANPLTAVKGGIETLLDLPLEEQARRQMLEAMLASAQQLERVALHPEQVGEEEAGLRPSPAPLGSDRALTAVGDSAGQVEADFRDANRQIVDAIDVASEREVTFICECSARDCVTPLRMRLDRYFEVHTDGAQFVIVPEHNLPTVEDVVHKDTDWWIVRKRGKPARHARRRN